MPRIRTLKPEHRQHRKVGALDHVTYRLWVGMILEADDEGRLVYDPEALRVVIFGYHPQVSRIIVERSAKILESSRMLRIYSVNGQAYAWFPSWKDHQRIDHPTPSKFPEPPAKFPEPPANSPEINDSTNAREDSRTFASARDSSARARARIGREGKGSEGIGKDLTHSSDNDHSPPPSGGFARLWKLNPRKVNKAAAERAYRKLAPDTALLATLLAALTAQQSWADRQGRFFPHLATWLSARRWEDEPPVAPLLTDKTAGNLDVARRFVDRMQGGPRP